MVAELFDDLVDDFFLCYVFCCLRYFKQILFKGIGRTKPIFFSFLTNIAATSVPKALYLKTGVDMRNPFL